MAVTLKIFFQSLQNEKKYYSMLLNFPDFFRTTNSQSSVCHLKWFKDCSLSVHPQNPSLSKHRHLMRSQTQNSMPVLFCTWNCLELRLIWFRELTPGNNSFTLWALPHTGGLVYSVIYSFICSIVHSFIKYSLIKITASCPHETCILVGVTDNSMWTNKWTTWFQ